jgi:hypothetical protein
VSSFLCFFVSTNKNRLFVFRLELKNAIISIQVTLLMLWFFIYRNFFSFYIFFQSKYIYILHVMYVKTKAMQEILNNENKTKEPFHYHPIILLHFIFHFLYLRSNELIISFNLIVRHSFISFLL